MQVLLVCTSVFFSQSCSSPTYDEATPIANSLEKKAAIDDVHLFLSRSDCGGALDRIQPLYASINTDNEIRMAMASTYGCYTGISFLRLLNDFIHFGGSLGGSGFWEFMAEEFPSTSNPDDKIPQSAKNSTDAILATVKSGTVFVPGLSINLNTHNPGSLLTDDRISDANAYLTFISMALMGSLENRYGSPDSNYHQTVDLPWTTAATTKGDGCAFAAALLNFYDGIHFVSSVSPPEVASKYDAVNSFIGSALDVACTQGCQIICGGTVTCSRCPTTLRDRAACTGVNTDVNSCAAAGIITFVNASWD